MTDTEFLESAWLLDYKNDVHSQHGEDGILEKIIETVGDKEKWCVEFGAWDGMHLTNTRNLIQSHGFSAVLIEASKSRSVELRSNYKDNSKVTTVQKFVGFEADDGLDSILKNTPIPQDFTLLSIDIDGNDYHVWEAIKNYQPKIVVIEFNPTFPVGVEFVQPRESNVNQGSSLSSIVRLAKEKGYELVSVLEINAFFVKRELYPLFRIECNDPKVLHKDEKYTTYFSVGYDGSIILSGAKNMVWHGLKVHESDVQIVPKVIRQYTGNYSFTQRVIFWLFRKMRSFRNL